MIEPTTKRAYAGLSDYAQRQGAPAAAFIAAGWHETTHQGRPALEYPTATGPRWRYLDGKEPRHDSPKGYQFCWYGLNRAVQLADSNTPLILVNGAPSVIVGQHYGLPVFASSGGESSAINPAMLNELKTIWQGEIVIAADSDDAGKLHAGKRARQLLDAGFICRAVDLQLFKNGDFADFARINGSQAVTLLATLPEIAPAEPPPRPHLVYISAGDDHRAEFIRDQVLPAIERTSAARRGKHFQCINPAHVDDHPSARIAPGRDGSDLYFCTCGTHNLMTVARWLGLDFKQWLKETHPRPCRKSNKQRPPVEPARRFHGEGLPDSWRSGLLNYAPNAAAFVVEELYTNAARKGYINPEGFTAPDLAQASAHLGMNVTAATIKAGSAALIEIGFWRVFNIEKQGEDSMLKIHQNPPGGRPATTYTHATLTECRRALVYAAAPVINERKHGETPYTITPRMVSDWQDAPQLAQDLNRASQRLYQQYGPEIVRASRRARAELFHLKHDLRDTTSTPLPTGWPVTNSTTARIAFLRATKEAGFTGGQGEIARLLGISRQSVNKYAEAAGCDIQHHEAVPERFTDANALKSQVDTACKQYNGAPAYIQTRTGKERYTPAAAAAIIQQEKSVTICFQPRNEYIPRPDAQPQAQPARPAATGSAQPQARPAAPVIPLERERLKSGYSRQLFRARLLAILRTWKPVNGTYQNPETGVLVNPAAPLETLLSEIVGYPVYAIGAPGSQEERVG